MENLDMLSHAEEFTANKSEYLLFMIASLRWINGLVGFRFILPPRYQMGNSIDADEFFELWMQDIDSALRQMLPVELENEEGIRILSAVAQRRLDLLLKMASS